MNDRFYLRPSSSDDPNVKEDLVKSITDWVLKCRDDFQKKNYKIYIAGHTGMVGSAILRHLQQIGFKNIITKTRSELDLTRQNQVEDFFNAYKPEYIIDCAAKVGGVHANDFYTGDFIRENILIQTNLIENARRVNCKKFCFLGSSCIYPRLCPQPIKEEYLLTSEMEKTNIGYAIAKIAGVQMIRSYKQQFSFPGYSLMPTNMYGFFDNFDLETSHVLPALLRKVHEAKANNAPYVTVWGSGKPYREFLYVEDLSQIVVKTLFMDNIPELLNVGTGVDLTIYDLALLIKKVVGYDGEIKYDPSKPDGTPRKVLDVSKMHSLGLKAETDLETGIKLTYEWYKENIK